MVVRGRLGALGVLFFTATGAAEPPPESDRSSIEAPAPSAPPPPAPKPPELSPPRVLEAPAPPYPEGATGDAAVLLELTVLRDGSVGEVELVSGTAPFAETAITAARAFRFEPARRDGEPISARVRFELRFHAPEPAPLAEEAPAAPGEPSRAPPPAPAPTEVIVRGTRPEAPKATFTRAEVREIPGTFGDPFRAIEIIPGVTPIVTGVPYFFIRGSPPGNVGYFLDGVRVPLLFHFALGPSVVHPGLIDRVDLYAGGYPARYGRFAGGVVAAETTEPKPVLHGEGNIRLYDAGALIETPFADGRGQALVGGRYSYTGGILSLIAPEVTLAYWDYQARISYGLTPQDRLSVFAFGAYDLFTVEDTSTESGIGSQFHRVDLRWDRKLSAATKLRSAATLGLDRSGNAGDDDNLLIAQDYMAAGRLELEHRASEQALIRAGLDTTVDELRFSIEEQLDDTTTRTIGLEPRTDIAVGARADMVLAATRGVTVTPGLRLDLYTSGGEVALGVDPRISARFDVSRSISLENSFGIVHQPPSFVIPIPGFQIDPLAGGLQTSAQSSAGLEWRLGGEWTTNLTLFHNAFFNITDFLSASRIESANDEGDLLQRSLGQAYGLEFTLKRPLTRRFGGYLAYTLMRSERTYADVSQAASFDRTHTLHLAGAFDLGRRWRFGSRLTFYTGTPARAVNIANETDIPPSAPNGEPPFDGGRNPKQPPSLEERAPPFFRLDLRLEKRWLIGNSGAWISWVLEVLNTTLSREVLDYQCSPRRCAGEAIGPVTVPSIGVEAAF
jgi:TonB family protein